MSELPNNAKSYCPSLQNQPTSHHSAENSGKFSSGADAAPGLYRTNQSRSFFLKKQLKELKLLCGVAHLCMCMLLEAVVGAVPKSVSYREKQNGRGLIQQ